jgi:hypothetical protein
MSKLQSELHRLYLPKATTDPAESVLIDQRGMVRAMVLELARPADWDTVSALWRGVQSDLELPAPAIAVTGSDGFQLWFSLAEAVPAEQARAFLEGLRLRYWAEIATQRIRTLPTAQAQAPERFQHADLVPALQPRSGYWSAFVTADLAPMFAETPWMDIRPGDDGQAGVLKRLLCISPETFAAAWTQLCPEASALLASTAKPIEGSVPLPASGAGAPAKNPSPRQFLLQVMNDDSTPLALRIEAAKALIASGSSED